MSLEAAMREELTAISGLTNKIFPVSAPENTATPYLVYLSSEGVNDRTLSGFLSSKTVSVELNILSDTYESLKTITSGVIQRLQSFAGRTIGTAGPYVQEIVIDAPIEAFEDKTKLYIATFEIRVSF
jgi:hypothetical protein